MPSGWNFFGRPDQGVKKDGEVTAYALPYLDHVLRQYAVLPLGTPDERTTTLRKLVDEIIIRRKTKPDSIDVSDIFLAEEAVLNLLSLEELRRRAPFLRDKYRTDMGEATYAMYQASGPPDPATVTTVEPLRADLSRLLDEIHWIYTITPVREGIRSRISGKISLSLLLIGFIGTIYGIVAQFLCPVAFFWVAPLASFMGAAGAFVSLQQRIQSIPSSGDPIFNIFALKEGKASLYLSPVSGALFATLMYLLFVGGYFKGELFPTFRGDPPIQPPAAATGDTGARADNTSANQEKEQAKAKAEQSTTMSRYLSQMDPVSASDLAKLLIWCFIAGFAERLIPDTLNRLIVRKLEGVLPGVERGDSIRDLLKQMVEQATTTADAKRDAAHDHEAVDKNKETEVASIQETAIRKEKEAKMQAIQDLQSDEADPLEIAKGVVTKIADVQTEAIHQTEDAERRGAEARSDVREEEARRIEQSVAAEPGEEVKPQPASPVLENPPTSPPSAGPTAGK